MGDETQPTVGQSAGYAGVLSEFAGPYVSEMLGKGAALADMPYNAYTGPLSAGASPLQEQAFTGYGALNTSPTTGLGSFSAMGAPMMGGMGSFQPSNTAAPFVPQGGPSQPSVTAQYINPYLQAALDPQLREARRQADISRVQDAARLTKAGAFGGSRQAIMESEGRRNLGQLQSDITAKGYADAFEKARSQFNEEERRRIAAEQADRAYGLSALEAQERAGTRQRDIEQEGITADYLQFEKERKYPYEQLAFQQSLLSGLPIAARQESYIEPSGYSTTAGGLNDILRLLSKFGIGALA
jgi:hypothetical protein